MGDRLAYLSRRLKEAVVKLKDIQPIKFEIDSHFGYGMYGLNDEQGLNYTLGLIQDATLSMLLTGNPLNGMVFQAGTQIASFVGRKIKNEMSHYGRWKSQQYSSLR